MSDVPPGLPAPEPAAAEHGRRVEAHLRAEIERAGGWLDFARFMEAALYAPGLGYYNAGAAKLGAAGDFVTAPERGELFGRCLARSLMGLLDRCPQAEIVELGAGSGALAETVLGELAAGGTLPARYRIVEPSPELAARQRERLEALPPRQRRLLRWEGSLPEDIDDGIVLANEVADALPVRRFRWDGERALPLGVAWEAGRFQWRLGGYEASLDRAVRERLGEALWAPLPPGYESELCTVLADWVAGVLGGLRRGLALIVDYGLPRAEYYRPERHGGTLRCHYRHRAHSDPLALVGLQDITAWVDFTAVAEAAVAAGWEVAGFATQAHFLLDAGLAEVLAESPAEGPAALALQQEAKALTLPGEMGERFRVMALSRELAVPPPGFGFRDLRERL